MLGTMAQKSEAVAPAIDPTLYKTVCSHWPSGVAVITAAGPGGDLYGLTMSAVIALSLDPMQFLISIDNGSTTLPIIKNSQRFCINFLNTTQGEIGMLFASKAADKLALVEHSISIWGPPVIKGAVASIICAVTAVYPGGDHQIIVGDVLEMENRGGEPLVHFRRTFHTLIVAA